MISDTKDLMLNAAIDHFTMLEVPEDSAQESS